MTRAALLLAAAMLSGCLGTSISGLGAFLCPDGAFCTMTIDSTRIVPTPPGLPGVPLPLP